MEKKVYVVESLRRDYRKLYLMTEEQFKAIERIITDFELENDIWIGEPFDDAEIIE